MNIFSYLRVSGKGQVDGDGPERQKQAIMSFCKGHNLENVGEYFEDISGTIEGMDRPRFSDMIEHAISWEVPAIVVERMDRLARDLMVSELLLAECRKHGIKVYAADQGKLEDMASNGDDPTRVLIRQILGALSQWDKSCTVKKLKAARDRVKAETGRCEGKKPYGFYPGEAKILQVIIALRAPIEIESGNMAGLPPSTESGMSWSGIAGVLNEAGHRTRCGTPWNKCSVERIATKRRNKKKVNTQ